MYRNPDEEEVATEDQPVESAAQAGNGDEEGGFGDGAAVSQADGE